MDRSAEQVRITIADDGIGLSPELAERIFDPFFTTKDAAKGVGLGLPMARAAVEAHGGSLTYTRLPEGSRFTLRLPLESPA